MWSISWLYVLEAVVIVTGNIITIVIFTTTPRLVRRQYVLIVSLAVTDLLVGLVSVPMYVIKEEMKTPSIYRVINSVQENVFGTVSLLGLASLAIERAHATYFPFKHSTLSQVPYIVGIAVVWMTALLTGIGTVPHFSTRVINLLTKFSRIGISLFIVILGYLLILVNVRCMVTTLPRHVIHHGNKKLATTLAIVTVVSLLAWCPRQFLALCSALASSGGEKAQCQSLPAVRHVAKLLQYSNSFANFFIYALRMRDFRTELTRRVQGFKFISRISPNQPITNGSLGG